MNKDVIVQKLRKKSRELNLNYNVTLSKFFFDEFLRLLAGSKYKNNFLLKGGMLLTYSLGIQNRTTQDIDFLVKGIELNVEDIKQILNDILERTDSSDIWFEMKDKVDSIRADDDYGGLKFHIVGHLLNIQVPFSIDIATGDPVYPLPEFEQYSTLLGDPIEIKLYPLESVLSEKLQTVLMRAENNSRSKDFYDIYAILTRQGKKINSKELRAAVTQTFKYRKSDITKARAKEIISCINNDKGIQDRWYRYQRKNPYAQGIEFTKIISSLHTLVDMAM